MDSGVIIVVLLGVAFLFFGIRSQTKLKKKKQSEDYKEVMGTIIGFNRVEDYDKENGHSTTYYPIIEYEVDGEKYEYESKVGSNFRKGKGKQKKLLYNINNPSDAVNPNDTIGIVFAILGVIIIGLGIFSIFK